MLQWRSSQGRGILSKLMCGVQVWSIRHTSIPSWGGHVEAGHRDTEKDQLTFSHLIRSLLTVAKHLVVDWSVQRWDWRDNHLTPQYPFWWQEQHPTLWSSAFELNWIDNVHLKYLSDWITSQISLTIIHHRNVLPVLMQMYVTLDRSV